MKNYLFLCLVFMLQSSVCLKGLAQANLPLSIPFIDSYYRSQQIQGKFDSTVSFLLRPLNFQVFEEGFTAPFLKDGLSLKRGKWLSIRPLPFSTNVKINQKQPFGRNDGALLPARGYQQLTSLGFAFKTGPLRAQFYPEIFYAENKPYDGFPLDAADVLWVRYYNSQLNRIDTPERFGEVPIHQQNWGQSFIKIEVGPMSLGLSHENIFWGPGKMNSLVMSNNARGFAHLTLNSNKPIKTAIGQFEMQLIGARLENSGFDPPNSNFVYSESFIKKKKVNDWRYLSGITGTYQPKWIPRLFFGFSRVVQQYSKLAKENSDYFGAFGSLMRNGDISNDDEGARDQLGSLFVRYYSAKSGDEIYFEFARNDAFWNLRDFFLEPGHAAGYLLGYSKIAPFKGKESQFIEANFEMTILSQSANRMIRNASTFYIHGQVLHGYTNYGEVIGAGIGPSSNSLTFNIAWLKGINRLGIQIERYVHNNDLYIELFSDIQDPRRHWIDASLFLKGTLQKNRLILNTELGVIKSFNYQYQIYDQLRTGEFFVPGIDVINFSSSLNLIYLL